MFLKKFNEKYDLVTIAVSILAMAVLVIGTIFFSDTIVSSLEKAKHWVIYNLMWFIIPVAIFIFLSCVWLICSKYGNIRMGKCKPEYGWFGYAAMIFCTAIGTSIIFWPFVEWAEYVCSTGCWPFGWDVAEMAKYSIGFDYFHWGTVCWSLYAIGIIPLGYRYYVLKKPGLTLQDSCEGLLGHKLVHGPLGTVINIFFIFGILGGLTITFGTGIPMMANFMHTIFGVPEDFLTNALLMAAVTALFSWSSLSGIKKGIINLSKLCIYFSCAGLLLILIFGNTGFIAKEASVSLFHHLGNFPRMLFNMGVAENGSSFAAEWTCFIWAWVLGLAPVMWVFVVKCSKGRSIRNILLTVLGSGFVSSLLFFGIISGNSKSLYGNFDWSTLGQGTTPIDKFYNTWDEYTFISDTLNETTLFPKLITGVLLIACFFLLVTTMDSSAFTMAEATQKGLRPGEDPGKGLRFFWCIMLIIAPLCLLAVDAGTKSFTAVVILSSIPVIFVIAIALLGSVKWIFRDFGHMSRKEIKEYFMTDEEKEALKKSGN